MCTFIKICVPFSVLGPGRGRRGRGSAAEARGCCDVSLDGRVAPRVEDAPQSDILDNHLFSRSTTVMGMTCWSYSIWAISTGSIISLGTLISTGAPIEIWRAREPIIRAFSNLLCFSICGLSRQRDRGGTRPHKKGFPELPRRQ